MTIFARTKTEIKSCCAKRSVVDTKCEIGKKIFHRLNTSLSESPPSISCLEGLLSDLCMNHKRKVQMPLNGMICKRKASACLPNLGKDYDTCIYTSAPFNNNRQKAPILVLSRKQMPIPCSHHETKIVRQSWGCFVDAYDESEPIEF